MISTGVFSSLESFMVREDYESVVEDLRFPDGLTWSLPVTLATDKSTAKALKEGSKLALVNGGGQPVATMLLRERYRYDKERETRLIYKTTDPDHPGVAALYKQGEVLLGGEVELLRSPDHGPFPGYFYEPDAGGSAAERHDRERCAGDQDHVGLLP